MSKHVPRYKRWTEISPTHYRTTCGQIKTNLKGKWDAFVEYKILTKSITDVYFSTRVDNCGEYKRAREAMMAVEDKARLLNKNPKVIILIDDSLL